MSNERTNGYRARGMGWERSHAARAESGAAKGSLGEHRDVGKEVPKRARWVELRWNCGRGGCSI